MGIVLGKIDVEQPAHTVVETKSNYEIRRYPASVAATVNASSLDGPMTDKEFQNAAFRMLARYIGVFGDAANKKADNAEKIAMTAPVVMTPDESEKIAMTAPVVMTPNESEKIAMTAPVVMTPKDSENIAMTAPVVMTPAEGEKVAMTAPVVTEGVADGDKRAMTFLLPSKYNSVESAPVPTNPAVKLSMIPAGKTVAVTKFAGNVNMQVGVQKAKELMALLEADGIKVTGDWTLCGYNPPFTLPWLKTNEIHVPVSVHSE